MNRPQRILTTAGGFLVGVVFAGLATAGTWQLLARFLPVESESVTLIRWEEVGKSFFFELADDSELVDRISVPRFAWKKRLQLSRSNDLRLERSRLGGLPVALADFDRGPSDLIPKGGVLEKLLEGTREKLPEEEPSARFDLLFPLPGTVITAFLGLGIWTFVTTRLWFSPQAEEKARFESFAFTAGSVVGLIGVIAWLG
ncbi:MAG: hypothetical protein AAGC68_14915 [Verrucomicrobiota bacterium]